MTAIDLSALRAAAEGATPGPWIHEHDDYGDEWWFGGLQGGGQETIARTPGNPWIVTNTPHANDAAYIAAASPDVVLALLDRLEAAEAKVAEVQAFAEEWASETGYPMQAPRPGGLVDDMRAMAIWAEHPLDVVLTPKPKAWRRYVMAPEGHVEALRSDAAPQGDHRDDHDDAEPREDRRP